jgi:hypothetical protein
LINKIRALFENFEAKLNAEMSEKTAAEEASIAKFNATVAMLT